MILSNQHVQIKRLFPPFLVHKKQSSCSYCDINKETNIHEGVSQFYAFVISYRELEQTLQH